MYGWLQIKLAHALIYSQAAHMISWAQHTENAQQIKHIIKCFNWYLILWIVHSDFSVLWCLKFRNGWSDEVRVHRIWFDWKRVWSLEKEFPISIEQCQYMQFSIFARKWNFRPFPVSTSTFIAWKMAIKLLPWYFRMINIERFHSNRHEVCHTNRTNWKCTFTNDAITLYNKRSDEV